MTDGRQHPAILASDAERGAAVDRLRQAVVEGRLTLEEFSDRVGLAQSARTDQSPPVPPVQGAPVLRIKASGPGGTLYVRSGREQPMGRAQFLGKGDPQT